MNMRLVFCIRVQGIDTISDDMEIYRSHPYYTSPCCKHMHGVSTGLCLCSANGSQFLCTSENIASLHLKPRRQRACFECTEKWLKERTCRSRESNSLKSVSLKLRCWYYRAAGAAGIIGPLADLHHRDTHDRLLRI